jgi:hypothetical protein
MNRWLAAGSVMNPGLLRFESPGFDETLWYPSPGPLARATLSRWERDLSQVWLLADFEVY